jgi:protease-4
MRFAGKVWKLLVGIKDGLVLLLMLLFFGLLYAALSASPKLGRGDQGALLVNLSGPIVEQPAQATASDLLQGAVISEHRLRDIVKSLDAAATDARVKAVVLDLDVFTGGGQATLSAVGGALDRVRKAGKPVLAFASSYSDGGYQLAAHASEVWLDPMGGVIVAGPGGQNLFFKGLMDKLGVTANVYRAGTYKAAVEPFTRTDMSPESREANQALAASLWESWQQGVRSARPKAQVAAYVADPSGRIAAAGGDMARAALAMGLVDRIGDRGAFERHVAGIVGREDSDVAGSYRRIELEPWIEAHPADNRGGDIGVLTIAGTIVDGEAPAGTAGAETIVAALEEALRFGGMRALVLRIDSPGGSALASERIRRAVLAAKAEGIPVVVSMGDVAASGGYWIAMAGDRIYAEPSTITGSIGVFGILPSFEGAMAKLGIGVDGVKTTSLSGEPDLLRGPGPEADRLLQTAVESIYSRFLSIVSQSRKLPVAQIDRIAQGRVWDGGTARQLGLVDAFGGLDEAIADAARRAGLDPAEASVAFLEKESSFGEAMLAAFAEEETGAPRDTFSRISGQREAMVRAALGEAELLLRSAAVQAHCLECPRQVSARRPSAATSSWLIRLLGGA